MTAHGYPGVALTCSARRSLRPSEGTISAQECISHSQHYIGEGALVDTSQPPDAYTLAMRQTPFRMMIDLNPAELELIERAGRRSGASPSDFVRDAALRAARGVNRRAPNESSAALDGAGTAAPPSRRSLRRSITRAQIPMPEVVRQLSQHLGLQLLAITVDAAPVDIDRWGTGEAAPPPTQERRLREAHEVWQFVLSVESLQMTRAWWMGMKDGLDDLSPAEAIAADRARDVMAVARYFVEAG